MRMPTLAVGAVAAVATIAAAGPALATAPALARPAASRTLGASVFPGLSHAARTGAVPASQRLSTALVLSRPYPAAEAVLNAALYDKSSPAYHHFLTPTQFAARFGVAPATEAAARAFVTAHGMVVTKASDTGDVLFLSGTAAQADKTFGVALGEYRYGTTTFFANATAVKVPRALPITGVIGLNSLLKSHTFATRAPMSATPRTAGVRPDQSMCTGGVCTGLTTPQDLWSIYDQPSSDMGQGQKMAIFGEGQTDPVIANLRTFENLHGLRRIPINVIHTDGATADYSDNSGEVEWDLDTQSSTGMSPNALEEDLYFGRDLSDSSTLSVLTSWVGTTNGPLQASASYGECEENPVGSAANMAPGAQTPEGGYAGSAGGAYTAAYEAQLTQATSTGKTLFASTGDTGSSCPVVVAAVVGAGNGVANQGFPVVNYPAASPHVVAVGGTVLYSDGATATNGDSVAKRALEYAWTFTGGGTSQVFAKPDYQTGITPVTAPCLISPGGTGTTPAAPGTICRGIPDIAAQSGDVASNGYAIVSGGQSNYPGGGTSLSSPLSMGMWTRVQAASPTGGNGFADETYYAQAKKDAGQGAANPTDVRDFFDVGGTAKSEPSGNGAYTPLPRSAGNPEGWDFVSGLGVPDITNLTQDVDGTTTPRDAALPPEAALPGTGTGGPVASPGCLPAYTDAKGDDAFIGDPSGSGGNPQLDILQGDLHFLTVGGVPTLQTVMTIANLSTDGASAGGAANEYYSLWTYAGTQYFTVAEVDSVTKAITYSYGSVSGNMFSTAGSATSGTFSPGVNGTIVIDVALASVGVKAPESSTTLLAPAGQTRVLVGSTATGGLIEQADAGSDNSMSFSLGESCPSTGRPGTSGGDPASGAGPTASLPEAPYAALIPLVGFGALGLVTLRRRRRTARA